MPQYQIDFRDGTSAEVSGPEGATVAQLLAILKKQKEEKPALDFTALDAANEAYLKALRTETVEEADIIDQGQELIKGVVSGATGLVESAALGAITPLPEDIESSLRKGIQAVGRAATWEAEKGHEQLVGRKFGEALGSYIPLAASALVPVAGWGIAGTLAVGAGAGEASERARAAGATEEERGLSAFLGGGVGFSELISPMRIVKVFRKGLGPKTANEILRRGRRILTEAGIEGAQEFVAGVAQNLIEKNIYNPEKGEFEGTGEAFGYGAGVGGFVQTIMEIIAPRTRGAPPPPSQRELFGEDVDLGTRPPIQGPPGAQRELFPDTDLGTAPDEVRDPRQLDLLAPEAYDERPPVDTPVRARYRKRADMAALARDRFGPGPDIDTPIPFYPLTPEERLEEEELQRRQPDMFEELNRREAEELDALQKREAAEATGQRDARERAALQARLSGDIDALEQPDLFAIEQEQEDRRLGVPRFPVDQFMDVPEGAEVTAPVAPEEQGDILAFIEEENRRAAEQEEAQRIRDEAQRVRDESVLETADLQRDTRQQQATAQRRTAILQDVIADTPTQQESTLINNFSRALAADGITNTQPTDAERNNIRRAISIKRTIPVVEQELTEEAVDPRSLAPPTDLSALEGAIPSADRPPRVDIPIPKDVPPRGRWQPGDAREPSMRERNVRAIEQGRLEADLAEYESIQQPTLEDPATVGEPVPLAEPVQQSLPGLGVPFAEKEAAGLAARPSAPDPGVLITKEILDSIDPAPNKNVRKVFARIEGKTLNDTSDTKNGTPRQQLAKLAGLASTPLRVKSTINKFLGDFPDAQRDIWERKTKPRAPRPRRPEGPEGPEGVQPDPGTPRPSAAEPEGILQPEELATPAPLDIPDDIRTQPGPPAAAPEEILKAEEKVTPGEEVTEREAKRDFTREGQMAAQRKAELKEGGPELVEAAQKVRDLGQERRDLEEESLQLRGEASDAGNRDDMKEFTRLSNEADAIRERLKPGGELDVKEDTALKARREIETRAERAEAAKLERERAAKAKAKEDKRQAKLAREKATKDIPTEEEVSKDIQELAAETVAIDKKDKSVSTEGVDVTVVPAKGRPKHPTEQRQNKRFSEEQILINDAAIAAGFTEGNNERIEATTNPEYYRQHIPYAYSSELTKATRKILDALPSEDMQKILTLMKKNLGKSKMGRPSIDKTGAAAAKIFFGKFNHVANALEAIGFDILHSPGKITKEFKETAAGDRVKDAKGNSIEDPESVLWNDHTTQTGKNNAILAQKWIENNLSEEVNLAFKDILRLELSELAAIRKRSGEIRSKKEMDFIKGMDAFIAKLNIKVDPDAPATFAASDEERQTLEKLVDMSDLDVEADTSITEDTDQDIVGAMYVATGVKQIPTSQVGSLDISVHPTVRRLLQTGELRLALRALRATSTGRVSEIAGAFSRVVGDTKVVIKSHVTNEVGEPVSGYFDPKTNTITLDAETGINPHVILHEMTHAATAATIANPSHPLTKKLNKLFRDVRDSGLLDTYYGAKDLDEFVSEALGNPEFHRKLAAINPEGKELTALQRFFNTVGNFVRRLVGWKTKPDDFSVDKVDNLIRAMLSPAPESRDAALLNIFSPSERIGKVFQHLEGTQKFFGSDALVDPQKTRDGIKDFLFSSGTAARKIFMSLGGTLRLGDVAFASGLGRLGVDLHVLIEKQKGAMRTSDVRVQKIIDDIVPWMRKNPKLKAALDRVIYSGKYGATVHQVDPTKPIDHYSKYSLRYEDANGNTQWRYFNTDKARDAAIEARKDKKLKARKGLDPDLGKVDIWRTQRKDWNSIGGEGQNVYKKMRDSYREQYEELKLVINRQIEGLLQSDPNDSAEVKKEKAANVAKLRDEIYARMFDASTLDVYFPLLREGRHKLSYGKKDPQSPDEAYVMEMFTSRSARDRAAKELRADPNIVQVEIHPEEMKLGDYASAPPASFVAQTLEVIEKIPVDPAKPGTSTEAKEEIMRLFIATLPETSFAKAMQKRKGTPGYIQDSLFGMKTKGFDIGRQTQRLKYSALLRAHDRKVVEAKLPEGWVKKQAGRKSLIAKIEKNIILSFEETKDEMVKRSKFARQGAQFKEFERYIKTMNQGAFINTIGFNVSSAAVNLSQIPIFAYPYMANKHGWGKAFSAIMNSQSFIMRSKNSIDELYDIDANGNYVVKSGLDKGVHEELGFTGLSKKQIQELADMDVLIKTAMERGHMGHSALKEYMGLEEGGRAATGHFGNRLLDRTAGVSAIFFNAAERYNRQTLIMANYKLEFEAMTKGKKSKRYYVYTQGKFINTGALTKAERKQLAADEALYQTEQLNGGIMLETAPRATQQNVFRMAGMYKSFGLNMYATMLRSAKTALDTEADPELRKIAARQLASVYGSIGLMAGLQGVPLYGGIAALFDMLWYEDDEEDFDTNVRKYIGEGWYKGWLSQATGIDVSNRIKMTDLLWEENRYNQDPSAEENMWRIVGGPAGSTVKRYLRGVESLASGDPGSIERGIENFTPPAIANFWKNALPWGRIQREGVLTRRYDPMVKDLTAGELAGWAFGFAPTRFTLEQDKNMSLAEIGETVRKDRTRLLKRYYLARKMGDPDLAREVSRDIAKFNKRNAGTKAYIGFDTLKRSYKKNIETTAKDIHSGIQYYKGLDWKLKALGAGWDR